ncbi:efflux transporter outer membrane subunit [Bordetella genomosp. 5]|uniref:RND transporter n=1 Tax=Bordetella genomosp. 5 TaxID=1395608 RepID=A0A261TET4_9BORD|nr:efflux transporter outer membrane subunit [Bordetella genomosp. 5]OZI48129.1 hypothetical protein CAL25_17305 [Bordetella genomosp. 5]
MRRRFYSYVPLLCALWLSGCAAPAVPVETYLSRQAVPDRWDAAAALGNAPAEGSASAQWWRVFGDQRLDGLVDLALARNLDLHIAMLRVRQARNDARLMGTILTPEFTPSATGGVTKDLAHGNPSQRDYSSRFDVGYELDLWGKYGAAIDGADWALQASQYDRRAAALTLVASVAETYWTIALLKQKVEIQARNIERASRLMALILARRQSGFAGTADTERAAQDLATQRIVARQLASQLHTTRLGLAALLGEEAGWVNPLEPLALPTEPPPDVALDQPAAVLARRPDVQAAEARLRASYSRAEVTRLQFYPTILLGAGRSGGASRDLGDILSNPLGSLGFTLALPFLQFRKAQFTVTQAQLQYEEVGLQFGRTLYNALIEVERGLAVALQQRDEGALRQAVLDRARKVESISGARYLAGQDGLKDWLDAQQSTRQAESDVLDNRYEQLRTTLRLIQAMGG